MHYTDLLFGPIYISQMSKISFIKNLVIAVKRCGGDCTVLVMRGHEIFYVAVSLEENKISNTVFYLTCLGCAFYYFT